MGEKKKTSSLGIIPHIPQNDLPFLKNKNKKLGVVV